MCILYARSPTSKDLDKVLYFDHLDKWVEAHASIIVGLNLATTSLIIYRIWRTRHGSSEYSLFPTRLDAVLGIIFESAMLQLMPEVLLLIFQYMDSSAAYIFLQIMAPVIVSDCFVV